MGKKASTKHRWLLWLHIYLKFNVTLQEKKRAANEAKTGSGERRGEQQVDEADKKCTVCLAAIPENQIENLYAIRARLF